MAASARSISALAPSPIMPRTADKRRRREPHLGQHLRQHGMDVGRGLHQGAVEVEDDGAGTGGHGRRLRVERVGEIA